MTLPLFARKFIIDAVETGIAAVLALTFVLPQSGEQVRDTALVIGAAVAGALVSAVRRAVPDFIVWMKAQLDVPAEGGTDNT